MKTTGVISCVRLQCESVHLFLSEMVTLSNSPHPFSAATSNVDIETDTDYLKTARKGGGHKGTL